MSFPTPLDAASATAAKPPAPALKRVLFSLSLSMLLSSLGTSIANVALPALTQAFPLPFRRSNGWCWPTC